MSDDPFRDLIGRLFPRDETPSEPEPRGNFSPREGNNPAKPDPNQQMRDFVRHLFAPTD